MTSFFFYVQEYLLSEAQPSQWLFKEKKLINKTRLAVDLVKAACLDYLPDEVPYKLQFKLNYFEDYEGKMRLLVLLFL